ncbi:MAG: trypsin-like peptidase domain-containing protein [Aureliella sp.]
MIQNKILRNAAFFSFALLTLPAAAEDVVIVNRGHEAWHYWAEDGRPPKGWNTNDFDDKAWNKGAAPLGYGVDGIATTISFGEDDKNKHAAAFFRLTFDVDDPDAHPARLGELRCDDGAVVYLNGTEIYRFNMPEGDLAQATFASGELSGFRESKYHAFHIDRGLLVTGQNVLAISVHQCEPESEDLLMDFALKASSEANAPETKPLRSDGVFQDDRDIAKYIYRSATHLLKQDLAPNPTRLRAGLGRILDREVELIEPSDTPLSPDEFFERCAPGVLIITPVMETNGNLPSSASGFVISEDGLALTNHHVVQAVGAWDLVATTLSGRVVRVKEVLASSAADDIALIQLEGDGFQPLPIAKSVPVGAELVAISHPAGADGIMPGGMGNEFFTLTKGHLARYRTFEGRPMAMVTTPYSLGSSGAPILDRFGSVACVVSRTRSFGARRVDVEVKDGEIRAGKANPRGIHLAMDHQMTLGITVPHQSIRAFLELQPLGPAQTVEASAPGLNWQHYEGSWGSLPDFAAFQPTDRGTCESPAVDVHGGSTDDFALVFTGFIDLPTDGVWQFGTTSDDGSRLYIDDDLVVDNDGIHAPVERTGYRRLAAGLHAIRIEYFERGNGEELTLRFSGPDQPWIEIPASAFRRPAASEEVTDTPFDPNKVDAFRKELQDASKADSTQSKERPNASVSRHLEEPTDYINNSDFRETHVVSLGCGGDCLSPLYYFPLASHYHLVDLFQWGSDPEGMLSEIVARLKSVHPDATVEVTKQGFLTYCKKNPHLYREQDARIRISLQDSEVAKELEANPTKRTLYARENITAEIMAKPEVFCDRVEIRVEWKSASLGAMKKTYYLYGADYNQAAYNNYILSGIPDGDRVGAIVKEMAYSPKKEELSKYTDRLMKGGLFITDHGFSKEDGIPIDHSWETMNELVKNGTFKASKLDYRGPEILRGYPSPNRFDFYFYKKR